MASKSKTLYVGFTNVLQQRADQHKAKLNPDSFTSKYNCHKLVNYEEFEYVLDAINREKQVKKWRREKKIGLIETVNREWLDLSAEWTER